MKQQYVKVSGFGIVVAPIMSRVVTYSRLLLHFDPYGSLGIVSLVRGKLYICSMSMTK